MIATTRRDRLAWWLCNRVLRIVQASCERLAGVDLPVAADDVAGAQRAAYGREVAS